MTARLLADESIRSRLAQDCSVHTRVVREVLAARSAGQLEDALALRTCALELHSLKGVASVLALHPVASVIGELCEAMLACKVPEHPDFWSDFSRFFLGVVGCVSASVEGRPQETALKAAVALRERLLNQLGAAPALGKRATEPDHRHDLSPSAGRRVLLVDDSATVRAALSARLADRGYPVRAARSLMETARLLEEFDPEIVVTDVRMPNVEGDELCRRIKQHMARVVPVLLYSSLPDAELSELARAAGADGYICKINGFEALIQRMDELFGEEILF